MPRADLSSAPEWVRPSTSTGEGHDVAADAGSARPDLRRPDLRRPDLRRPDLAWRALLALLALVATLLGAPTYVVGALTGAALVLAVERLARSRGQGAADSMLMLAGGLAVVLVLVGLVMGSTPIGLSTTTWGVGLSLVALLGIGLATIAPRPDPPARAAWLAGAKAAPWAVAVVAVSAISIGVSVRSIGPAERPPVQMAFGQVRGSQVQVVVSASQTTGPLELRTSADGNEISYPLFTVGAGQRQTTTLALPASGRFVISLNYPDQSQPLRSLILDR